MLSNDGLSHIPHTDLSSPDSKGKTALSGTVRSIRSKEFTEVNAGLRAVGYRGKLLRIDYKYADVLADELVSRSVPLAAFAQDPPSYVNACFAATTPNGDPRSRVEQCVALGAPQILVLHPGFVDRWVLKTELSPEHEERIPTSEVRNAFLARKEQWSPETVLRAKCPLPPGRPRQVDFVDIGLLPALEHQAQQKLNELILDVVRAARSIFEEEYPGRPLPERELYQLLFSLIRAKVLKDTGVLPAIDLSSPADALCQVGQYYRGHEGVAEKVLDHREILAVAADRVARSFLFHNLSVDTLAHVYQNALVSPEHRKRLGIHGTPSHVAHYIMGRLPLEETQTDAIKVLDPTCGSGTFLVAAVRRLRGLLPASMSPLKRHSFYVSHLKGMEIDPFSREVAYLSLVLADLPNPDGWKIAEVNSFLPGNLESAASQATVLVGNPPFEAFEPEERALYNAETPMKGGEMLRRALPALPQGALVGVVMPRKLLDGRSYAEVRRYLASSFDMVEITCLPDRVFPTSEAGTVLLLARKLPAHRKPARHVLFREVMPEDRTAFQTAYAVSREQRVSHARLVESTTRQAPVFWVPRLAPIWDALAQGPRIGDFAEPRRGVEYELGLLKTKRQSLIRDRPFDGGVSGLADVKRQLMPYVLGDPVFLATDPMYRRRGAWGLPWHDTKVVVNAKRASRGPWRIAAAVDRNGLLCTQAFYGLWPKGGSMPPELLAAALNGPVANAFIYDHEPERDNRKQTLLRVPFPTEWEAVAPTITGLVSRYVEARIKGNERAAVETILRIDAQVLRAYALPPREERLLLDLFWDHERPGVGGFRGYMPPEFTAWIPLHVYLSQSFRDSTVEAVRSQAPNLADPDIERFFEEIS